MKRLNLMEYLQGLALLGIVVLNMIWIVQVLQPEVVPFDRYVRIALDYVVYERFFVLFFFMLAVGYIGSVSPARGREDSV
ncbi:hypothetical protein ACFQ88_28450 [Paenibacillus sp. NPDC056579]|uniref:hypothetical protein n=1 Tax=unclassified Paenibacillus TaxID=185978 RepID=UPI001EF88A85|nr:hypothetical protein [Paenibacillus sp. H1-7]ULL19136.1 hypothetical protein DVH26_34800 [Paenibacillus sp. H1-7]